MANTSWMLILLNVKMESALHSFEMISQTPMVCPESGIHAIVTGPSHENCFPVRMLDIRLNRLHMWVVRCTPKQPSELINIEDYKMIVIDSNNRNKQITRRRNTPGNSLIPALLQHWTKMNFSDVSGHQPYMWDTYMQTKHSFT